MRAIVALLLLVAAGCSDKPGKPEIPESPEKPEKPKRSERAEKPAKAAESFPGATPEEFAHIRACLEAIDDGRESFAMRYAREFMDSTNAEVRLQAVEAFGWIGKHAVKELAEMMADADEEVASEAQRQWEMAFDEYTGEAVKAQEIERAAGLLKDQDKLEAVMMKVADLEDYNAVKLLSGIIASTNASAVAVEVAREEYASLTGEPFADARRAEQLAAMLKDEAGGSQSQKQDIRGENNETAH